MGNGHTAKRLNDDDLATLAELLRVALADVLDDEMLRVWRPRLREVREKMIERLADLEDLEDLEETACAPQDLAHWATFLPTVRVGGALPVTFRMDDDHVLVEVIVPYVTPEARTSAEPNKIPLAIAEGFPVPVTARCKLPPFSAESAAAFVRHIVREIYLHEADEQLRVGDRRPFAPEH